jgi:hypothetical protein
MRGIYVLLLLVLLIGLNVYTITARAQGDAPTVSGATTDTAPDSASKTPTGPAEGTQHETISSSGGPYSVNRIDALHYRVPRGKFNFNAGFESPLQDSQQQSSLGQTTSDISRSFLSATVSASYGISDSLLINLSQTDLLNENETSANTPNGSAAGYQFSGFSNPTLLMNYRFLGALADTKFAAVSLSYSPSTGVSHKAHSATNAGNDLSGYNVANVAITGGWVAGAHEWLLEAQARYLDHGTFDATDSNNSETSDPAWQYFAIATYRYHYAKNLFADLTSTFALPYTRYYYYPNQSPVYNEEDDYAFNFTPGFTLGWRTAPKALLKLTYSFESSVFHYEGTNGSNPNQITAISQQQFLTLGGVFEF